MPKWSWKWFWRRRIVWNLWRANNVAHTPHFSSFPRFLNKFGYQIPDTPVVPFQNPIQITSLSVLRTFLTFFSVWFLLNPSRQQKQIHTTIHIPHIVHMFSLLLCFVFEFEFVRVVLCYAIGGNVSYEVLNYKTPKCAPSEHAHTQILTLPDTETYTHV